MQTDSRTSQQRLKHFSFILAGQVVSLFGSALTSFALGVWAFQQLGSVSAFSGIYFATAFGAVITLPFAGTIIDRKNKKLILLASALASAFISASIAILYFSGLLQIWHIVVLSGLNGIAMAFSKPAITASVKILVDSEDLTRANGLIATAFGLITLVAPSVAGFLILKIDLIGILLIDLSTFLIGLFVLSFLKLPPHQYAPEEAMLKSIAFAWGYLKERNALLWLIGFYFVLNLLCAAMVVLITPLILTFADAQALGLVLTISGLGYLVGAIIIGTWNVGERKVFVILASALLMSLGTAILPITTNIFIITLGAFLITLGLPISLACNQTIIQKKVDSQYIGRVDSLGTLLINLAMPLGYISAGPIAQFVFEPFMAVATEQNALLSVIFGNGTGRGIALMISVIALVLAMVVTLAALNPKIRRIEIDLDDRN